MLRKTALTAFMSIFLADFLVRTAYMAGKSPVLPVFADALGANEVFLGMIVGISTFTGLFLKPIFGFLSDRHGQYAWLIIGTFLFSLVPLLYFGVSSTTDLVALRLFHGVATAIYGPVTLAYVASLGSQPRAEKFGWFGLARTSAYVVGPLLGGTLLTLMSPEWVFASTSLIAVVAFFPILFLRQISTAAITDSGLRLHAKLSAAFSSIFRNTPLFAFGMTELTSRVGIYAVKTFVPLMILSQGGTAIQAGGFLSIQELAVALTRPVAGYVADRTDCPTWVAVGGLVCMSVALLLLPYANHVEGLVLVAIVLGIGNGAYHPAVLSMISNAAEFENRGLAFGVVGTLKNLGKLLGPVAGGALIQCTSFQTAFLILGLITVAAIMPLLYAGNNQGVRGQKASFMR